MPPPLASFILLNPPFLLQCREVHDRLTLRVQQHMDEHIAEMGMDGCLLTSLDCLRVFALSSVLLPMLMTSPFSAPASLCSSFNCSWHDQDAAEIELQSSRQEHEDRDIAEGKDAVQGSQPVRPIQIGRRLIW